MRGAGCGRPGGAVRAPGPETAHQILNTSNAALKYLAVNTMEAPDIREYPDSGKYAVFAGSAPGESQADRTFAIVGRHRDATDYWEGEE